MFYKKALAILFVVGAGVWSGGSAATDVINGTVSDFESGSPIAQVKVTSETYSAVSTATGAYQLVFGTVGTLQGRQALQQRTQKITWNPEKGSFAIAENAVEVSIAVQDIQGRVVARYASGPGFSIAHLPQGMYLVGVKAREYSGVLTIFKINAGGRAVYTMSASSSSPGSIMAGLSKSSAVAAATGANHVLTFMPPSGHVPKNIAVPAGTPSTSKVAVKLIAGVKIFNGTTMDGFKPANSTLFTVSAQDTSFKNVSGGGHMYYDSAYLNYRIIYMVRQPLTASHNPGFLMWGQNPSGGNMGGFQFQLPFEWTWDYGGHGVQMTLNDSVPQSIKNCGNATVCQRPFAVEWSQCEVVVDTKKGIAFAAVAHPVDTTATWIMTATSNSVKSYPACRFGFQIHDAGEGDEYKNLYVQSDPKTDTLLTTQEQMQIVAGPAAQ